MNTVLLVTNYDKKEIKVFGKKPESRRYVLDHPEDTVEIRELEWHYKTQLVEIMNSLLFMGQNLGHWLQPKPSLYEDEDEDDEPDLDPGWADADALASAGHGMDEDYM